jgi:hypothetical protein
MSLCDVISKLRLAIHATVHALIINTKAVITPCKFTEDVTAILCFLFLRKMIQRWLFLRCLMKYVDLMFVETIFVRIFTLIDVIF